MGHTDGESYTGPVDDRTGYPARSVQMRMQSGDCSDLQTPSLPTAPSLILTPVELGTSRPIFNPSAVQLPYESDQERKERNYNELVALLDGDQRMPLTSQSLHTHAPPIVPNVMNVPAFHQPTFAAHGRAGAFSPRNFGRLVTYQSPVPATVSPDFLAPAPARRIGLAPHQAIGRGSEPRCVTRQADTQTLPLPSYGQNYERYLSRRRGQLRSNALLQRTAFSGPRQIASTTFRNRYVPPSATSCRESDTCYTGTSTAASAIRSGAEGDLAEFSSRSPAHSASQIRTRSAPSLTIEQPQKTRNEEEHVVTQFCRFAINNISDEMMANASPQKAQVLLQAKNRVKNLWSQWSDGSLERKIVMEKIFKLLEENCSPPGVNINFAREFRYFQRGEPLTGASGPIMNIRNDRTNQERLRSVLPNRRGHDINDAKVFKPLMKEVMEREYLIWGLGEEKRRYPARIHESIHRGVRDFDTRGLNAPARGASSSSRLRNIESRVSEQITNCRSDSEMPPITAIRNLKKPADMAGPSSFTGVRGKEIEARIPKKICHGTVRQAYELENEGRRDSDSGRVENYDPAEKRPRLADYSSAPLSQRQGSCIRSSSDGEPVSTQDIERDKPSEPIQSNQKEYSSITTPEVSGMQSSIATFSNLDRNAVEGEPKTSKRGTTKSKNRGRGKRRRRGRSRGRGARVASGSEKRLANEMQNREVAGKETQKVSSHDLVNQVIDTNSERDRPRGEKEPGVDDESEDTDTCDTMLSAAVLRKKMEGIVMHFKLDRKVSKELLQLVSLAAEERLKKLFESLQEIVDVRIDRSKEHLKTDMCKENVAEKLEIMFAEEEHTLSTAAEQRARMRKERKRVEARRRAEEVARTLQNEKGLKADVISRRKESIAKEKKRIEDRNMSAALTGILAGISKSRKGPRTFQKVNEVTRISPTGTGGSSSLRKLARGSVGASTDEQDAENVERKLDFAERLNSLPPLPPFKAFEKPKTESETDGTKEKGEERTRFTLKPRRGITLRDCLFLMEYDADMKWSWIVYKWYARLGESNRT